MKHTIVKAKDIGIGHRILLPNKRQMVIYNIERKGVSLKFSSIDNHQYLFNEDSEVTTINKSNQNKKGRTI